MEAPSQPFHHGSTPQKGGKTHSTQPPLTQFFPAESLAQPQGGSVQTISSPVRAALISRMERRHSAPCKGISLLVTGDAWLPVGSSRSKRESTA